jgi:hypothetical protein
MSDRCYLCGSTAQLTRDHVPPKGFFPTPLPSNLITVPCCQACNASYQLDDEAVRAFFSIAVGRSAAGDWIWEQKVVGSTVARSPRFREELLSRIGSPDVSTPLDAQNLCPVNLPTERIERFITRLTKGLIHHYFPDYDYSTSTFQVKHIPPTEESARTVHEIMAGRPGTSYDERGNGVIRYQYGISDTGLSGIWFFMFYDAMFYLVMHTRKVA